jgi:hypothetical protein
MLGTGTGIYVGAGTEDEGEMYERKKGEMPQG